MGRASRNRPDRIGRYVLKEELGRGTMGVVYRAQDPVLGRPIALKTINLGALLSARQRDAFEQRFLTEARVAAQLQHPGIVVVHDLGRDDASGMLFIALELLAGESLADWIAEGRRPPWQEVLRIVGRAAEALHHAHGKGIVHRDVKPANIMMLPGGEPKIMDFGIAKIDTSNLTVPGEVFGTPLYMSPEQALGRTADARSDIFSLGSIAYVLLTGETPFQAPDVPGILARVAHLEPPLPSEREPELPAAVDYVVARAMAKDPERRFQTARAMAEDIEDVRAGRPPRHRQDWRPEEHGDATIASVAGRVAEPPAAAAPPPRTRGRRARLLLLLAVVLALAGILHDPTLPTFWFQEARRAPWREWLDRLGLPESLIPAQEDGAIPTPSPVSLLERGGALATSLSAPEPTSAEPGVGPEPAGAAPGAVALDGLEAPPQSPVPGPSATPSPSSAESVASGSSSTVSKLARLRLELEPVPVKGTLRVWVDGRSVLDRSVDGRKTSRVQELLELAPGRRRVRVEVRWNGYVASGRLAATLPADTTRRLAVHAQDGQLRLRWK